MRTAWVVLTGLGGLLVGAAFTAAVAAVAGYAAIRAAEHRVREGEELVSVVVFARDLPARHRVAFEDVSSRLIPARLVTSSVVTPESANYVVNQVVAAPHLAGDPLRWSAFVAPPKELERSAHVVFEECQQAVSAAGPLHSVQAIRAAVVKP